MNEPVLEDHLLDGLSRVVRQSPPVDTGGVEGCQVIDFDPADALDGQHPRLTRNLRKSSRNTPLQILDQGAG